MNNITNTFFPKNNSMDYELERSDIDTVLICKYIASSFSLVGTILIMTSYLFLCLQVRCNKKRTFSVAEHKKDEEDKEKKYQSLKMGFGNDLIFCLSISDFMISIFSFIKSQAIYDDRIDNICITQGFISNYFEISSVCWTSSITFSIILGIKIKDPSTISNSYLYLFIYSNLLPAIFSFGPLITGSYGPAGAWCWLNIRNNNDTKALIWSLSIYTFQWVNIIFNIVAIILSINYFKVRAFEIKEEKREESCFLRDYCIVLKFFPMILVMCFLPATLNRAFCFITDKENTALYSLQAFFFHFQGFLNSIVYSYYYRNLFKKCCEKQKNDEVIVTLEVQSMNTSNILSNTNSNQNNKI